MKQLERAGIGKHALEVRRVIGAVGELHGVADPVARRHLCQAKPVAVGAEAHRLGVDGHDGAEIEPIRQIVLVEFDFQGFRPIGGHVKRT